VLKTSEARRHQLESLASIIEQNKELQTQGKDLNDEILQMMEERQCLS
jgi:hypothetical protein